MIIADAVTNISTVQTNITLVQMTFPSELVGYNSRFHWEVIKSSQTRCKIRYIISFYSFLSLEEQMLSITDIYILVKHEQMPS